MSFSVFSGISADAFAEGDDVEPYLVNNANQMSGFYFVFLRVL